MVFHRHEEILFVGGIAAVVMKKMRLGVDSPPRAYGGRRHREIVVLAKFACAYSLRVGKGYRSDEKEAENHRE